MMRVSIDWLKDYVDIAGINPEEMAARLTMAGIAVDKIDVENGDSILELELTPNRGDCHGLLNVAREVAAIFEKEFLPPRTILKEQGAGQASDYICVKIDEPELCRRYAARVIVDVKVEPSPLWMQERLERAGIRVINNIVDITNYVMLETNQPLHAFDYEAVGDKSIIVRRAVEGEKIMTLDGSEKILRPDMLVIADGVRPIALAGIMGGENSEITLSTKVVLLESANFNQVSIRRSSVRMATRTESSLRFEKGADPETVSLALDRAVCLIEELGAGKVVPGVVDQYLAPWHPTVIDLKPGRVNKVLGSQISGDQMVKFLNRLGFVVTDGKEGYKVTVPSHRIDVSGEADLIEEIARLYGYDNIEATLPGGSISVTGFKKISFGQKVTDILAGSLNQVITYSFINPNVFDMLNIPASSNMRQVIKVANPLSEEQSVMRTTLLGSLLETTARNVKRQNEDVAIFELGRVYIPSANQLPDEDLKVAAVLTGKTPLSWAGQRKDMDFYYLKGIVEHLLEQLSIAEVKWVVNDDNHTFHPYRTAALYAGDLLIGILGELHPLVLEAFDLKKKAVGFELSVEALEKAANPTKLTQSVPRYPSISRDLSIVVPEQVTAQEIGDLIKETAGQLLRQVVIFDIYRSPQIGVGNKSLTITLKYQSDERTLREEEVAEIGNLIIEGLSAQLNASLR